jgi:flagella basal body P-ring formation protein FlgA
MRVIGLTTCLFISQLSCANEFQSLEVIKQKIEQYSQQQLAKTLIKDASVTIGSIDSRLKLKHCNEQDVRVFSPYHKTIIDTSTLGVKCSSKTVNWTIYVPIKIKASVAVLTSQNYLIRDHKIRNNDILIQKRDIHRLKRGYFTNKQQVVGKLAKRNIGKGKVITPADLKQAKLVYKGERVIISAVGKSLKVSMKGVAVNSGSVGEIIRVKNLSSSRIIEAKVVARGKVQVII